MIALTRILVPHDFGATSTTAMAYATSLAKMFGAALDVLHVGDADKTDISLDFQGRQIGMDQATGVLQAVGLPVEMNLPIDFHVRSGTPHAEIVRYASERQTDLIVMGTHGRGRVAHAVLGSVAERVVRTSPCPVLIVRKPPQEFVAPNILVATDFGAAAATALYYGRELGRTFGARLHLLHVADNYFLRPTISDPHALEASTRQRLNEQLTVDDRRTLLAKAVLALSEHTSTTIVDYANSEKIDLVVIGTDGRSGVDRLLIGSVAERVVRSAPCSVLTVRHPEHEFIVEETRAAEDPAVAHAGSTTTERRSVP